jgi:DNA end-binding protein Ku
MGKAKRVALAKFTTRGKESLVLIRSAQKGLMLHFMYFADEVRDFSEVDKGDESKIKPGEMDLAQRLIDELSKDAFRPDQYADEYRTRVLAAVEQKVEGQEITSLAPQAQRTQVIDLMEALKQSLGSRSSGGKSASGGARGGEGLEKKPAAKARQKAEAPREKKVSGGKR